jgi:thiol-disulfide isomerase/thioredoxin
MKSIRGFNLLFPVLALYAANETPASKIWIELKAKREKLASVHQEFEVVRTSRLATGNQSSKTEIILDMASVQWREKSVSGSGTRVHIFDGTEFFYMDEGGDEFVRIKRRAKDPDPVPSPYLAIETDWSKSKEIERRPCGFSNQNHDCVILDVRLKPWSHSGSGTSFTNMVDGSARMMLDLETGLILSLRTSEAIQGRTSYVRDVAYGLTRLSYGGQPDPAFFKLPSDVHEVKELSRWNAAKIRKQLFGKPAPELAVTDIEGKPVTLSGFKGKTVLLDFWTTWCPPCRADAPSLDKLYRKYGEKDLVIIGISVSEERAIVEKFLKAHPHEFPVVLTTENEIPASFQIGVFPTYIVIERDGTVGPAVDGDQGFSELRKLLKKAGLEVD